MNMDFINEQTAALRQQLDELNMTLSQVRDERNDLLRQRFDLKEQRRYYRRQLREAQEAGNDSRITSLEERLQNLQDQLDTLEERIENLDDHIGDIEDNMEEVQDALDDLQDELEQTSEGQKKPHSVHGEFHLDTDGLDKAMDSLNKGLQKLLGKVADTLENVDFDNLGQNVQNAATKAAKTVTNVAQDAAKEVESAYKDLKENREKPGGIGDYRISGTGTLDGGCYNHISVSGACKVSSDLVCRELKSSGSFKACGNVDVSGETRTSGAFSCDGNLTAGNFSGSGSTKIQGDMKGGSISVPGALNVAGGISATSIHVSGSLKVGGDCEADSFTASGSLSVGGIINADKVNINLSRSESTVGSIGGSEVTVSQSATAGIFASILPAYGSLKCESIEGDTLDLTGVHADTVRGTTVVIRSGCHIDKVEYSDTCSIDGSAVVGSCVKV